MNIKAQSKKLTAAIEIMKARKESAFLTEVNINQAGNFKITINELYDKHIKRLNEDKAFLIELVDRCRYLTKLYESIPIVDKTSKDRAALVNTMYELDCTYVEFLHYTDTAGLPNHLSTLVDIVDSE